MAKIKTACPVQSKNKGGSKKKKPQALSEEHKRLLAETRLVPDKEDPAFQRIVDSYKGILKDLDYSSDDFVRDRKKELELEDR